jgi:Glycosyl hydrolase catalytic core/Beta-galactosidase
VAKQVRGEVGEKQGVLVHYWVLSLLLLGPLSAWIHASEPWDPWNNPYGICTHQTTPDALRVIKAAGIGWIRIDITWSALEPSERGQFAWGGLDAVVHLAREQQLKIYATVGGTPAWAADPQIQPDPGRGTYNVPPADPGDWMNYLRALVMRYSGDIQTYGLWNEPNQGNWKGSPESYVQLIVNPAARTIKTACPACTVVAGDLLHREPSCRFDAFGRCWSTEGEEQDWRKWMTAILTSAAFTDGQIDILSHHIYAGSDFANVALAVRSYLDRHGAQGKDLWITETGLNTRHAGIDDGDQANYYVNALEGLRRKGVWGHSGQGLISRVFFYEFLESGGEGWGIVKDVGGQFIPKPAYYAYQRYIGAHP